MRPKTAHAFHPHERTQTTTTGYIYILTNPSFPQYGKLGYATDVKQRLAELNRSTAVPFAFRVYATYEVDSALSDKEAPLHSGQAEPRSAFCRRRSKAASDILSSLQTSNYSTQEVPLAARKRIRLEAVPQKAAGVAGALHGAAG